MNAADLGVIDLEIDAFASGIPHETFRRLREHDPVHWYQEAAGRGYWAITKHADLVAVHKDSATFSSQMGAVALEDLSEEDLRARRSMLETDPPEHSRLRSLVNREFTPRVVAGYEELLRMLSRSVLDRALSKESFDFVAEVADPLPIQVLTRLFGVPMEDEKQLIGWVDRLTGNADPEISDAVLDSPESEQYRRLPFRSPASLEIFEYGHRLAAERRRRPGDDIVTKLVEARIDGEQLNEREFDTMFLLMLVAGNETTRQAIAQGFRALIEHPGEMERLRADPTLMPTAVEEILRWSNPVLHFRRTATRDVEFRGKAIKRGDKVVNWYVSANHDEEVFVDSFRFDVGRRPNDHVTFGKGGPHHCLGAPLARLEIRVLFEELLPRIEGAEITGPFPRMRSNWSNALRHLPVRVKLAAGTGV